MLQVSSVDVSGGGSCKWATEYYVEEYYVNEYYVEAYYAKEYYVWLQMGKGILCEGSEEIGGSLLHLAHINSDHCSALWTV